MRTLGADTSIAAPTAWQASSAGYWGTFAGSCAATGACAGTI
jgi:hypothetical protein